MIYLHYHVNDYLGFYHGQIYWGKTQTNWLSHPLQTLINIFRDIPFYYILFIAISVYIAFRLWNKKMYPELVFLTLSLLAPIAAGTFMSYGRYLFILFPIYLIIADNVISHQIVSYFLVSAFAMFNFIFYSYLMTSNF